MKSKLTTILFGFAGVLFLNGIVLKSKPPLKFSYQYVDKKQDSIKLDIENISKKTIYYSIALQGFNDSIWVPLLSDINSLGKNEFLVLKPIKPGSRVTKYISKQRVYFLYSYQKIHQIRFGAMYYEKKDLDSKGGIVYGDNLD